jgi:hypothetical protein
MAIKIFYLYKKKEEIIEVFIAIKCELTFIAQFKSTIIKRGSFNIKFK